MSAELQKLPTDVKELWLTWLRNPNLLVWFNDYHHWSFERIAEWIEKYL